MRLHGVLITIVSDRDSVFVAHFRKNLHQALGIKLNFNTAFQMFKDMLQGCMLYFEGSWDQHLPLMEFAYSSN